LSSQNVLPGAVLRATSSRHVDNSVLRALVFSCNDCSVAGPRARICTNRIRRGGAVGFGDDGGRRGEDIGAIRGDPAMWRYFGVEAGAVGRRRGDDGRDRTPDPLTPALFSNTDKNVRPPEE
jgi:hypothetical protein